MERVECCKGKGLGSVEEEHSAFVWYFQESLRVPWKTDAVVKALSTWPLSLLAWGKQRPAVHSCKNMPKIRAYLVRSGFIPHIIHRQHVRTGPKWAAKGCYCDCDALVSMIRVALLNSIPSVFCIRSTAISSSFFLPSFVRPSVLPSTYHNCRSSEHKKTWFEINCSVFL